MRDFYGLYKGTVTATNDPEGLGRLRAQVPQIIGELETDWAWPVSPNVRDIAELTVGDPVWISFEGGDVTKPLWHGTWIRLGKTLPLLPLSGVADIAAALAAETAARIAGDVAESAARIAADALKIDKTKLYAIRTYARANFR